MSLFRVVGDVAADFIRVNLRASAVRLYVLCDLLRLIFSLRSGRRFDHDHGRTDWSYFGEVEPGLLNQSSVVV